MADQPSDDRFVSELMSSISMLLLATWTVSEGSRRSLDTRQLLKQQGEAQPTLDQRSALMLPLVSSSMLLILFFLFKYIQNFLVLYMVVAAFGAISFALYEPLSDRWPSLAQNLGCGCLVLSTRVASILCGIVAASIVALWLYSSHWMVLDIIGVCLTISVIAVLRVPSLKIACIALVSLFVYDIFWVFYSSHIFGDNVMVEVATKKADNPIQKMGEHMDVSMMKEAVSNLQLPIKLMFPSGTVQGYQTFHMLGLGDMALPGLFLAFALTFDQYLDAMTDRAEDHVSSDVESGQIPTTNALRQRQAKASVSEGSDGETEKETIVRQMPVKREYFWLARRGYLFGLICSIFASRFFGIAQPALLYLVPSVLLPIILRARSRGQLKPLWSGFRFPEDDIQENET